MMLRKSQTFNFYIYFFILFITACAKNYKIDNFNSYIKTNIPVDPSFDKSINITGDSYKIVVPTFSVTNSKDASELGLDISATSYLSKELQKYGVSILDRTASDKIANELSLIEMHGGLKAKKQQPTKNIMPDIADFAIVGSIDEVTFSNSLSDMGLINTVANVSLALATGGRYIGGGTVVASRYKYKSTVSGSISLIDLSTNKVLIKTYFSESLEDSEAAQGYGGGLITISELKKAKDKDSNLVSDTLKSALIHKIPEIMHQLSPVGYIVERRDIDNKTPPIFKISAGKNDGLMCKDVVRFIKHVSHTNPLTNAVENNEEIIANGVVSNLIENEYSWVIVENPSEASALQLGTKGIITKVFKK
jgi:hypothetical protein